VDEPKAMDVVLPHFNKDFDTVPHSTLRDKLSNCGMSSFMVRWVKNWPDSRAQRVVMNGHTSSWQLVTSGAPEGSILGPVQYLYRLDARVECTIMLTIPNWGVQEV